MNILRKVIEIIINILFSFIKKKFDLTNENSETSETSSKAASNTKEKPAVKPKPKPKKNFYNHLKNLYLEHGAQWDNINIFGVRDVTNVKKDVFNDYIGVAIDNKVHLFKGTCDPSVYWTKKGGAGAKKNGVAHICLGYYKNVYMVGLHKGYEAMVQRGSSIKIWRDSNNNFRKDDSDIIEKGYFGVNIHRASAYHVLENIGKYSAGCQVIQDPKDFEKFLNIVKGSEKYSKKGKRAKFSYFLLKRSDIPDKYLT